MVAIKINTSTRFPYDRFVLLVPFLMWCLLPVLSYNIFARLLVVLTLSTFFLINFIKLLKKRNYVIKKTTLFVTIILIFMSLTNLYFSPSEYALRHLHFSVFMIFIVVSIQLLESKITTAKLIVTIVFIANIITLVLTIKGLVSDHNIARHLSKSNEYSQELASSGYGGYGVIYANLIMLPILFMFLNLLLETSKKPLLMIILCVSNIILTILLLIKAQYTIALLTASIIIFSLFFKFLKKHIFLFITFIVVLVVFVMSSPVTSALESFSEIFKGTRYQSKIIDVVAATSGTNDSEGPVRSRSEKYLVSITTTIENPILGVLGFGNDIGHHSDIIDKFAQWGIIVGMLIMYILIYFPFRLYKLLGTKYKLEVSLVIFALFVVGGFNTIPMEASVPFVLLSCFYVIKKSEFIPLKIGT